MFSAFFIRRPIFACVISIIILLAGFAAMRALSVEQYPQIVPPQVQVTAIYPGASAEVIAQTVAAPLEQQINGVEGMIYQQSTSAGSADHTCTSLPLTHSIRASAMPQVPAPRTPIFRFVTFISSESAARLSRRWHIPRKFGGGLSVSIVHETPANVNSLPDCTKLARVSPRF